MEIEISEKWIVKVNISMLSFSNFAVWVTWFICGFEFISLLAFAFPLLDIRIQLCQALIFL